MWLVTFAVVSLQGGLPLNPDDIGNMEPTLAFNTISSFVTNTNLQHYSGETGLSYLSQIVVITFLQFVTAATGVAACVAIIRGLAGNRLNARSATSMSTAHARRFACFCRSRCSSASILLWQGTPMTFQGAAKATTVEGADQTIARGVVAPEVAIKQLGTNGGGYFGPNSAHPYENPTPITNLAETWSITIIPMAMVWTLGHMVGRRRLAVVDLRDDARLVHPDGDLRRLAGRAAATSRSPRWASINRPARWKARKSGSAPACRRCGR